MFDLGTANLEISKTIRFWFLHIHICMFLNIAIFPVCNPVSDLK